MSDPPWPRGLVHLCHSICKIPPSLPTVGLLLKSSFHELHTDSSRQGTVFPPVMDKSSSHTCRGVPFLPSPPDKVIITDVSLHMGNHTAQGMWTSRESRMHINVLELQVARKVCKSFFPFICFHHVLIMSDKTTMVFYVSKQGGARSASLSTEAVNLWNWCIKNQSPCLQPTFRGCRICSQTPSADTLQSTMSENFMTLCSTTFSYNGWPQSGICSLPRPKTKVPHFVREEPSVTTPTVTLSFPGHTSSIMPSSCYHCCHECYSGTDRTG